MSDKVFTPSEAMVNNSNRGKAYKKKKKAERSYESPFSMVSKSMEDNLSLNEVKSLYTFLKKQKHKINKYNVDIDGDATWEYLDWLEAGGHAAYFFCQKVLNDEAILKTVKPKDVSLIEKEDTDKWDNVEIAKAYSEEKRRATFLVLEPQNEDYTTSDLHGDWYDAETIEESCFNFNKYCMKANLLHLVDTTVFEFLESYITQSDMVLGDRLIKKGSWLATIYVDKSELGEEIWQGVKTGYFNGLSVQCFAATQNIDEE